MSDIKNEGTLSEEVGGLKDRVVGGVKDAVGAVTGDRSLEREGEMQNAVGNARQEHNDVLGSNRAGMGAPTTGTVGEEVGGFKDRVVGGVKDAVGSVTGNDRLEREGEMQNAVGNARQEHNDVLGTSGTSRTYENKVVTGLFRDRESAERAYSSLTARGYSKDDIDLMMSDDTRAKHFSDSDMADTELGSKAMEGAGVGSAIGGTIGAILAGIAAIGTSVLLPGIGLVVAGPLAAALAGAGAGGLTGGLIGALVGSGIPEDRAQAYEQGLKDGGIVLGVRPRSAEDAEYFESEFRNSRGEHIYR